MTMEGPDAFDFMQKIETDQETETLLCRICKKEEKRETSLCVPCICEGEEKYAQEDCIVHKVFSEDSQTCATCGTHIRQRKTYKEKAHVSVPLRSCARYFAESAALQIKKTAIALLSLFFAGILCAQGVLLLLFLVSLCTRARAEAFRADMLCAAVFAHIVQRRALEQAAVLLYLLLFSSRRVVLDGREDEDVEISNEDESASACKRSESMSFVTILTGLGIFAKYRINDEYTVRNKTLTDTEICEIIRVLAFEEDKKLGARKSFEGVIQSICGAEWNCSPLVRACLTSALRRRLLALFFLPFCYLLGYLASVLFPLCVFDTVAARVHPGAPARVRALSGAAAERLSALCALSFGIEDGTTQEEHKLVQRAVSFFVRAVLGLDVVLWALYTRKGTARIKKHAHLTSEKVSNVLYVLAKVLMAVVLDRMLLPLLSGFVLLFFVACSFSGRYALFSRDLFASHRVPFAAAAHWVWDTQRSARSRSFSIHTLRESSGLALSPGSCEKGQKTRNAPQESFSPYPYTKYSCRLRRLSWLSWSYFLLFFCCGDLLRPCAR